ncbi:MAG: DUF2497 domain-containing protein [Wolbachia endosymbiont of Fragariocoptes setiger]|nr:DUF2497 domain-containing protein [Wolbachia endosymbiont of Fragariocoptes setiger]
MNDEQKNQSVKDILEDIKKAISGKTNTYPTVGKKDNNDVPNLKEEYLESSDHSVAKEDDDAMESQDDLAEYSQNKNDISNFEEQNEDDILNLEEEYSQNKNGVSNFEEQNEDDVLNLKEEYSQNKNDVSNFEEQNEDDILNLEKEYEQQEDLQKRSYEQTQQQQEVRENSIYQDNNYKHLILQKNIEEIKSLLGAMKSKLHPSKPMLTVEELVISLLKPELSEWLNKHLYSLVKEVVEKELKNVLNDDK